MKRHALKLALAATSIFALLPASHTLAAPQLYTFDEMHTYPFFEVNHLGWSTTRGFFAKAKGSATIDFMGKTGTMELSIDADSVQTGDVKRDKHLRDEDFFNVTNHPTIQFKSNKLNFEHNKIVSVDGELTLLGVTKPVALTIEGFKCGVHPIYKRDYCGADAYATIKRSEFGMSIYPGAIGEEVKLRIQVEAAKGSEWGPRKNE